MLLDKHKSGVSMVLKPPLMCRRTSQRRASQTALRQNKESVPACCAIPRTLQHPPPISRSRRGAHRRQSNDEKLVVFLTFGGDGSRIRKSSGPKECPPRVVPGAPPHQTRLPNFTKLFFSSATALRENFGDLLPRSKGLLVVLHTIEA